MQRIRHHKCLELNYDSGVSMGALCGLRGEDGPDHLFSYTKQYVGLGGLPNPTRLSQAKLIQINDK